MLDITNFLGEFPRLDRHMLPSNAALEAVNVDLSKGWISPWREPKQVASLPAETTVAHWRDCCWRGSNKKGAVIYTDPSNRTTYVSDPCNCPEYVVDFCSDSPPVALGYPRALPVTAALNTGDPDAFTELRTYFVTYGNDCQEGRPSLPSEPVKANKDDEVVIVLPEVPQSKYNITHVRVYRSAATWNPTQGYQSHDNDSHTSGYLNPENSDVKCFLVAELALEEAVGFIDSGSLVDIGGARVMTSMELDEPPEGLIIEGETDQQRLVGFKDNQVMFSEAGIPWGWPQKHRLTFPCTVRGLSVHGNTVIVLTSGTPFIVLDDAPCEMDSLGERTVRKIDIPYPLCSRRSMVSNANGVAFATPTALVFIDIEGQVRSLSSPFYSENDWAELAPAQMSAGRYRDAYVFTSPRGSGIFNVGMRANPTTEGATYTRIDRCCINVRCFIEGKSGELFYLDRRGYVLEWNAGRRFMPYTYRTPDWDLGGRRTLSVYQLMHVGLAPKETTTDPTSVTFHRDLADQGTRLVADNRPHRFLIRSASYFGMTLCGKHPIRAIRAAASITNLRPTV